LVGPVVECFLYDRIFYGSAWLRNIRRT
jgi:hypothetical protein